MNDDAPQAAPPPAPPDEPAHLEGIVVTASKRSVPLHDVPVAVTAFTEQNLRDMGADDLDDYVRAAPGVSMTDLGPGNKQVIMRGIATSAFSQSNVQATVSQYVDEMVISDSKGSQLDLKLFDVERVEILRGPQGTLYGAGSMGGALRIITNRPDPSGFSGGLDATRSYARDGGTNTHADGVANIPIGDDLAARVTGYYRKEDGYIDNPVLGQENINTDDTWGGRIAVQYLPSFLDYRLQINANMLTQESDLGMAAWRYSRDVGDLVSQNPTPESQNDKVRLYNLTLNYDLSWAGLTSASSLLDGHRDQRLSFHESADATNRAVFMGAPGFTEFPNTSEIIIPYNNDRIFTQEIRLASTEAGVFDWLAGLYYLDARNDIFTDVTNPEVFTDPRTAAIALAGDARPMLRPVVLREIAARRQAQKALFGEVSYHFSEHWAATAGLRAFRSEFENESLVDGLFLVFTDPQVGLQGPRMSMTQTREDKITSKYQITYQPTRNLNLFAVASQGYRVGGANPADPTTDPDGTRLTFRSDSLWNYELTAKTRWLDQRLTVNGSAYTIKWKDIQVGAPQSNATVPTVNGGNATVLGAELEVIGLPIRNLELRSTLSWTRAEFDEDVPGIGAHRGDRLPATPEWAGSASIQYEFPVIGAVRGRARFDYAYVGSSLVTPNEQALPGDERIGDYQLGNVRLALKRHPWEFGAFVDNLWNERAIVATTPVITQLTTTVRPRTTGLNLKFAF